MKKKLVFKHIISNLLYWEQILLNYACADLLGAANTKCRLYAAEPGIIDPYVLRYQNPRTCEACVPTPASMTIKPRAERADDLITAGNVSWEVPIGCY